MSAFQLVVLFAFVAIALGFSPTKTSFGRNVAVSKTQVYEVTLPLSALLSPSQTFPRILILPISGNLLTVVTIIKSSFHVLGLQLGLYEA